MILTRTPLRASLFGGGSDYPEYFLNHGGAVLGMAIDKYVYVGVKRMPPGQLGADGRPLRFRVQYSHVDDCQDPAEIRHPAVRAAVRYFRLEDRALEFHVFGDLPGRSGLGGSSSFSVGLLHALRRFLEPGREFDNIELAREAIPFEQRVIGEAVGSQDQIFAASGGLQFIEFGSPNYSTIHPLSVAPERLAELERSLVLVYSGTMRDAHVMAAQYVAGIPTSPNLLEKTMRLAHDGRTILEDESRSICELGLMLDQAWRLKRGVCNAVSTPAIDDLYQRGTDAGATGGKLLGAGGGGFMLFFVPPDNRAKFEANIGAPCVGFKVARDGSKVIIGEDS